MKKTEASSPALLRKKKQILKRMHRKKMKQIRMGRWMKKQARLKRARAQEHNEKKMHS